MYRTLIIISLLICSLQLPTALTAQISSKDSISISYKLNPVIITAARRAHAQRDIAASISIIDESSFQLSSSFSALEAVEEEVPGFHLTEWGIMGFGVAGKAAGKLSMRGIGGSANTHILILRNGRPDFMGLMGCTIADEFSSNGIGRIEIIRGPGSFLYGSNATGGIINFLPKKRNSPGFETSITAGAGTFSTHNISINHGGRIKQYDYYLTASHRQTDGHRKNSDYRGQHYTLHIGYTPNAKTSWEFNANLSDLYLKDPGQFANPMPNQWYDILRGGFDASGRILNKFGFMHLKVHANFGLHDFFSGWHSTDQILGFMLYQHLTPWSGNQVTLGLDIKKYGGKARDSAINYGSFTVTETAPYIHMQQFLAGRYIISAGLRTEKHSLYGWEALPKFGLVWHINNLMSSRLSLAKGFRSPSIRELYFWKPANINLTPDRVWNTELACSWHIKNRGRLELIYFNSRGSNLIQFNPSPPMWINSGNYTHNGLELLGRWQLASAIAFGATWSYTKPVDTQKPLLNAPEQKITAYLRYTKAMLKAQLTLVHIHNLTGALYPWPSPVPQFIPLNDYSLINLNIRSKLIGPLSIKLALNNILNESYESMAGYPMPGRHLFLNFIYGSEE
ncbi:TonB-dependent receptor [bacterium]|nr:TonB-dependent receptor [bacterium]